MKKSRVYRDTQKAEIEGTEYILVIDNITDYDENGSYKDDYFHYVSLNDKALPETGVADADWDIIEQGEWTTVSSERLFKYGK